MTNPMQMVGSSLKVSINPIASHILAECQGLFSR
jgi:hypothetical protein